MEWLPPWRSAAQYEWAKKRPWLAGCYSGLTLSVAFFFAGVLIGTSESLQSRMVFCAVMWPVSAVLYAMRIRYHWGERPDAEAHPAPTLRRMWSRLSDPLLLLGMGIGVAGAAFPAVLCINGSDRSWRAALVMAAGLWFATTTLLEWRRRRVP